MAIGPIVNELASIFESRQNPAAAVKMKAYMKGRFDYYGLSAPIRKELLKPYYNDLRDIIDENLIGFSKACWKHPKRELQYAALDIIAKRIKRIDGSHIKDLEYFVSTKSWWDTVDALASTMAGQILKSTPHLISTYTHKWIESDDFWLQRTALLFQLKYKDQVDEQLLYKLIQRRKGESEFFIRKAIGWSLRSYGRVNPESVLQFVEDNPDLSNLSKREALKHLQ